MHEKRVIEQVYCSSNSRNGNQFRSMHQLRRESFIVSLPLPHSCARYAEVSLHDREIVLSADLLSSVASKSWLSFSKTFEIQVIESASRESYELPKMAVTIDDIVTIDVAGASQISALCSGDVAGTHPQAGSNKVWPIDISAARTSICHTLVRRAIMSTLRDNLHLRTMSDILRTENSLEAEITLCAYAWSKNAIFITSDAHFFKTFGDSLRAFDCSFEYLTVLGDLDKMPLYIAPKSPMATIHPRSLVHKIMHAASRIPEILSQARSRRLSEHALTWRILGKDKAQETIQSGPSALTTSQNLNLDTRNESKTSRAALNYPSGRAKNAFAGDKRAQQNDGTLVDRPGKITYHYLSPRLAKGKAQRLMLDQPADLRLARQHSFDSSLPNLSKVMETSALIELADARHKRFVSSVEARHEVSPPNFDHARQVKNSHLMEFILF